MIFGLEFPPIENIVEWPSLGGDDSFFGFNKIALINVIALVGTAVLFMVGGRARSLVPRGAQNFVELSVDFIRGQVVAPTIGPHGGDKYLPLLTTLFFFIFIGNIFEVIPFFNMPSNARMANPAIMALYVWVFFIAVGFKHQGVGSYFKANLFPPGVPKALYVLVTPIEFISTFLVRPFSLAVRLFANMLAGHILLVTFSVLCITLWTLKPLLLALPFSFFMLVALTAFEVMVSFLQAYIFTILAAVYIGGAMHPDH
ncbi:MAG: F0F1 ATP synthase subunit A [Acidimicrobiia bacterium]|nr:F0F1 ATP synthase subunit A [Acidimicrobiia bacterium]